ncbi:hypothetical protein [Geopsychrobacter electrodiphilus]|uniref:hypothetical protein n=1 Tax=Geopsychrobacter electrodiphilus TaxID=225196 RepID=UPI000365F675|nr:hypothetical protein [Geopsychrobacter electrodiphilus]
MSILNFLKRIKLPSFEDEFIVDPVDEEVSPEHGRQMQILAAMHREKVLADKDLSGREDWLESLMQKSWDLHTDPSDAASLVADDP